MQILIILIIVVVLLFLWSLWGYFSSRVEQARYSIVDKKLEYEIRDYPKHIVAETTVQGSYDEALNEGFRIIARYIFGGNASRKSIAMTAPVLSENVNKSEKVSMTSPVVAVDAGNSWVIAFGMPSSHTMETLPVPIDTRVKIVEKQAQKFAVVRFFWSRGERRIRTIGEKLVEYLKRDNIPYKGSIRYAGYNAPWTLPWMQRHEVSVELV